MRMYREHWHVRDWNWNFIKSKSDIELRFEEFLKEMYLVNHQLSKIQAKTFRKKYMKDNFDELYRDNLPLYFKHLKMPIEKFLSEHCKYKKGLHNSQYHIKDTSFRAGNFIYGVNKKCNSFNRKFV